MTTFESQDPSATVSMQDLDTLIWSVTMLRVLSDPTNASAKWPDLPIEATECSLYYCVREYSMAVEGNQIKQNSSELSSFRRLKDSWLPYRLSPTGDITWVTLNGTAQESLAWDRTSSANRTDLALGDQHQQFNVSLDAVRSISMSFSTNFFANLSFGGVTGYWMDLGSGPDFKPDVLRILKETEDFNDRFETLALSMSNAIRMSKMDTTAVHGRLGQPVIKYRIEWPWITVPIIVVLASLIQLLITMHSSRARPIFKSSILAVLSRGPYVNGVFDGAETVKDLRDAASHENVCLFDMTEPMISPRHAKKFSIGSSTYTALSSPELTNDGHRLSPLHRRRSSHWADDSSTVVGDGNGDARANSGVMHGLGISSDESPLVSPRRAFLSSYHERSRSGGERVARDMSSFQERHKSAEMSSIVFWQIYLLSSAKLHSQTSLRHACMEALEALEAYWWSFELSASLASPASLVYKCAANIADGLPGHNDPGLNSCSSAQVESFCFRSYIRMNTLYQGLKLGPDDIRVLTLLPGAGGCSIVCELVKISLSEQPRYDALSYVWGDPTKTKPITVNGLQIQVTANLESALRHLRHETEPLTIWIDAVCIDQTNTEERNAQVKLMGEIYRKAATVFLWIGEGNAESDSAFDSMATIADGSLDDKIRRETCSFYASVGDRPWFSRVWILQEMALANEDPIVVCGSRRVLWTVFMAAWKVIARELFTEIGQTHTIANADGSEEVEVVAKLKIDVLDDLRQAVKAGPGEDLRKLLLISRTSESTDPRDRIYGLLGMLKSDENRESISVDYSLPTAKVYTQAMAHMFSKGIGPSFLSGTWLPGLSPAMRGLPSWVPDFSAQTGAKATSVWGVGFHPPHPLSVSGPGAGADNGRFLDNGETLQVKALPVDVVEEMLVVEKTLPEAIAQLGHIEDLVAAARRQPVVDEKLRPYFEKYRSAEPLWRVLVSNKRFNSGYDVAPEKYELQYEALRGVQGSLPQHVYDTVGVDEPELEYINSLRQHLLGHAFFTTKNGLYGLAVPEIRRGDEVTIWFGATIPFIIRRDGDTCRLIGGAYVGGIMAGEMVDELYCEELLDSKTLLVR
ncbi:hypothetical protein PRZ48_009668 [Zasmidium cellare]|uniref:Heterokaryon incompatibility domain-containing protein n=1 Tax=Zasmidium cellare TaxID=395010 RepID=A0ABR0ECC6_ZASCE|nr:hypothetical protein PRZ48_009668 [Zasmidium cellare]